MAGKSENFEKSMERLEQIVKAMEQGNVPLEESLKLFEEGTKLLKNCSKLLDEAEMKVMQITKGADGAPVETELQFNDI